MVDCRPFYEPGLGGDEIHILPVTITSLCWQISWIPFQVLEGNIFLSSRHCVFCLSPLELDPFWSLLFNLHSWISISALYPASFSLPAQSPLNLSFSLFAQPVFIFYASLLSESWSPPNSCSLHLHILGYPLAPARPHPLWFLVWSVPLLSPCTGKQSPCPFSGT